MQIVDQKSNLNSGAIQISLLFVLLLLVVGLGGLSRLINLGRLPLSPMEAEAALASWQFWQPSSVTVVPASPAYFTLTSLIIGFLGDSDITARLVPILFGLGLILLPWVLHFHLGDKGALAASLILAVSALGTISSRTAGGEMIALFAGTATIVCYFRFREKGETIWFYAFCLAIGLGLNSHPLFYTLLFSYAAAWLTQTIIGPRPTTLLPSLPATVVRNGLVAMIGLFLCLSTLFFWYPQGLSNAGNPLAQWFSQWGFPQSNYDWSLPISILIRYEPLVAIFSLGAILWILWHSEAISSFFAYTFLAGFLMTLLQPGILDNILLFVPIGSLLVGYFVNYWLEYKDPWQLLLPSWQKWGLAIFLLCVAAATIAGVGRQAKVLNVIPDNLIFLWLAMTFAVLGLAVVIYLGLWDRSLAIQGSLLGIFALLAYFSYGAGWWLGQTAGNDPRTSWVSLATDDELYLLVRTIKEIGSQFVRSDEGLHILSTVDSPVLRWYLRDMSQLEFTDSLPALSSAQAVTPDIVLTSNTTLPRLEADYVGSDFAILRLETSTNATWLESLKQWMFHEMSGSITEERIVMWVRTGLAGR